MTQGSHGSDTDTELWPARWGAGHLLKVIVRRASGKVGPGDSPSV